MPAGRPKIDIDIEEVERLAGLGLTQQQIADCLGIDEKTLRRHKENNSHIVQAIKRGQAKAIEKVTNSLYQQAVNEGNVTAAIFYLKNRDRENWKDRHDSSVSVRPESNAEPVSKSLEWIEDVFGGGQETAPKDTRTH